MSRQLTVRWLSAFALLGVVAAAAVFFGAHGPASAVGGQRGLDLRHAHGPDPKTKATPFHPEPAPPRTVTVAVPGGTAAAQEDDDSVVWKRVERYCPWPPTTPDTWTEISGECEAAMKDLNRYPVFRSSLRDPEETRHTVVAALDDPQCRVPPGAKRPDLYEACAAEALIPFAVMQDRCANVLGRDWERWDRRTRAAHFDPGTGNLIGPPRDQEDYYRRIEVIDRRVARGLWEHYLCAQVPPGVLDWIDVLPVPEANPARRPFVPVRTQAPELLEVARRLGAPRIPALASTPY